jgi:hypothetical protein
MRGTLDSFPGIHPCWITILTYKINFIFIAQRHNTCCNPCKYNDLQETHARYNPDSLTTGWNTMSDGEEVFFISTPSAGLWTTQEKLEKKRFPDIVT